MALNPSQINQTIKQRLDQQCRVWNVAHGANLSVEQTWEDFEALQKAMRCLN